jgi:hypothetical protein
MAANPHKQKLATSYSTSLSASYIWERLAKGGEFCGSKGDWRLLDDRHYGKEGTGIAIGRVEPFRDVAVSARGWPNQDSGYVG